jgi:hypothetical protein
MHPRRLTTFVLGLWLAGGVLMALIAAADNWQSDDLVDHPSAIFAVESRTLGAANGRALFHYQAEEQKRRNFEIWEMAQMVLASLFFLFILFGTDESKAAILAGLLLLVLVLSQRFFLSPNIASLGRLLDFVPAGVPSPWRAKLAVLGSGYWGVEIAKWLIQFTMATRLIVSRRGMESEGVRNYVNPIDKTNYRHINR